MDIIRRIIAALNPSNADPGAPLASNWLYLVAAAAGGLVLLLCQFGVSNPLIPCPEKAPSVEASPT